MIDAVTQFTNLYYNIVNLLTSESGRQFLENPAGYTSQKRIVVCFIKAIPEAQGLFSYYSPSRNPDTPLIGTPEYPIPRRAPGSRSIIPQQKYGTVVKARTSTPQRITSASLV